MALAALSTGAQAQDRTEIAKEARNPLPDFVILPIQNNTNLDFGPNRGVQDGLNIQPLFSFRLTPDLNVVTRTVIPLIFNPPVGRLHATEGLGDIQFTPFISPSASRYWTWGIGPIVQIPTHSHPTLGNDNLGLGPSIAAFHASKDDPWVLGFLAFSVWSVGTSPQARSYAAGSLQPLISYHLEHGFYFTSAPIIKIDWEAQLGRQVLLPVGGGVGTVVHLGKVPLNVEVGAYYNVLRRDFDADWQLRFQVQLIFPSHRPRAASN
jgi:hypothetical protein